MDTRSKLGIAAVALALAGAGYFAHSKLFKSWKSEQPRLAAELYDAVLATGQVPPQAEAGAKAFVDCFAKGTVDVLTQLKCASPTSKPLLPQIDKCIRANATPKVQGQLAMLNQKCMMEAMQGLLGE